jgi:hypothetical protein
MKLILENIPQSMEMKASLMVSRTHPMGVLAAD